MSDFWTGFVYGAASAFALIGFLSAFIGWIKMRNL